MSYGIKKVSHRLKGNDAHPQTTEQSAREFVVGTLKRRVHEYGKKPELQERY